MTDAGDQPLDRSEIVYLHAMPGEALFGFGATGQDRTELVDDAGSVGHQLGEAGLSDLVDDDRCQGTNGPGFGGAGEEAAFAEEIAGRKLVQLEFARFSSCVTTATPVRMTTSEFRVMPRSTRMSFLR